MINEINIFYWGKDGYNKEFIAQNIHLCLLFRIMLGENNIGKYKKIVIKLIDPEILSINNYNVERNIVHDLVQVVEIWNDFLLAEYNKKTQFEKRKIVWRIIKDCFVKIASKSNSEILPIEEVYQKGIKDGLQCVIEKDLITYNSSSGLWAGLLVKCDEDVMQLYVIVRDNNQVEKEKKLIAEYTPQMGYEIFYQLKKISWEKNEVVVYFKNKEKSITVSF